MKTNILWKGNKVIGTISGRSPNLSILPFQLMDKYGSNISLESRSQSNPIDEFTDSDGGIYGVRFFNFMPSQSGGFLVSPTSGFVWETTEGLAPDFNNQGAVRGHIGFHAAWPCSLENWVDSEIDHSRTPVKALVKGYGDLVQGTMGWRSERLTIIQLACEKPAHISPISARYKVPTFQYVPVAFSIELRGYEFTPEFQTWYNLAFPPPKPKRTKRSAEFL
jgi:hypothetical protein